MKHNCPVRINAKYMRSVKKILEELEKFDHLVELRKGEL